MVSTASVLHGVPKCAASRVHNTLALDFTYVVNSYGTGENTQVGHKRVRNLGRALCRITPRRTRCTKVCHACWHNHHSTAFHLVARFLSYRRLRPSATRNIDTMALLSLVSFHKAFSATTTEQLEQLIDSCWACALVFSDLENAHVVPQSEQNVSPARFTYIGNMSLTPGLLSVPLPIVYRRPKFPDFEYRQWDTSLPDLPSVFRQSGQPGVGFLPIGLGLFCPVRARRPPQESRQRPPTTSA